MSTASRDLLELTVQLLDILNDQMQRNATIMDDKLAEYVFFPLNNIFRQMHRYPMLLIENCIKCLTVLLTHGWKSKISPELVQQTLNLLTFIIDGVPDSSPKREVPEETVLESFRALTALLRTARSSPAAAMALADSEALPALGHGISVMLDGVVDGVTPLIQQEAIRAIQAVFEAIREHEALASFLPGTIFSFTKVLSRPGRYKSLALVRCLTATQQVLTRVLGDIPNRSLLAHGEAKDADAADKGKLLSPSWLKATTDQVKVALSNIMKLRTHDSQDVQRALQKLCVTLMDECHTTLANCNIILVETAMILDSGDDQSSLTQTSLRALVTIYPELGDTAKTAVYGWISSLPRIALGSDEVVKQHALQNLSKGIRILSDLHIESSTLEDSLNTCLRDCIGALARSSPPQGQNSISQNLLIEDASSTPTAASQPLPVLLPHESEKEVRSEMLGLLRTVSSTSKSSSITVSMLEYAQDSSPENQMAGLWLCFELIKAAQASSAEAGAVFDLSAFGSASEHTDDVLDGLYTLCVQVLDSHSDLEVVDWRREAIALEVVAYAAQRSGESFRPELIDVLFPVTTYLGSENRALQQHAIFTLNTIASACHYTSVSELIVDNVDYMVNSVALRLNTLDISPTSTKVLTMMIRLAGPRLIPFLDDVVESIFVALDNYHGYPAFVESLFAVLKEAVDQGVRSDMLLLENQQRSSVDHKKRSAQIGPFEDLLKFLDNRKQRQERDSAEEEVIPKGHPSTPWVSENKTSDSDEPQEDAAMAAAEEVKPPNSPTYQLLLRISNLAQHYLTSPTPKLRRSLLELLATASSALAADEDSFLPLVNAIWPVVIERLQDSEAYIIVEACHTLCGLCEAAGDFLSSRFTTEWYDGLGDWCRTVKKQASTYRPSGKSSEVADVALHSDT